MADAEDLLPLVTESVDDVRTRLDADANPGLAPTDPGYLDTTEGGFFWDQTQPCALEITRLRDFVASEVVAAMFVQFAWGIYLDYHGEASGVARKDASTATGVVTFTGDAGSLIATGAQIGVPPTDPDADVLTFRTVESGTITGSSIDLAVEAVQTGPEYNVAPGAISEPLSPMDGVTGISNAQSVTGGADIESDEAYRERLLLEFSRARGSGTVADYTAWALAWPGVGFVKVEPVWAGAGTVRVIIADASKQPSSPTVITDLQNDLDPIAGQGHGLAPIGHIVTVDTVTPVMVDLASATVIHDDGYSLDGTGGTVSTRAAIVAAVQDYFDSLGPGDDVVLARVESMFFRVRGVHDVTGVTLQVAPAAAAAANVTVAPLEVPLLGAVTLS